MKFRIILSTCLLSLLLILFGGFCNAAYFNVHCYFNDDCSCIQGDRACCMFKRENDITSTFGSCFCCPGTDITCPANTSTASGNNQACGCYKLLIVANLTQTNPISCRNHPSPSSNFAGTSATQILDEDQASMFVGQSGIFYSLDANRNRFPGNRNQ